MAKKGSPIQPLSVFLRTDPKLNLVELQGAINDWEDHFSIRLAILKVTRKMASPLMSIPTKKSTRTTSLFPSFSPLQAGALRPMTPWRKPGLSNTKTKRSEARKWYISAIR